MNLHKNYWILILIVFSLFIVAGCGSSPITVEIKYEVTGTVPSANITYQNFTGATDTLTGFALPWSKTFTVTIDRHRSFHAHVRAGNSTTGSLTANIYVNGILVRTSTNSGSFQLVSISYTIWNN